MSLTKPQLQWVILGSIAGLIALLAVLQFLVIPLRQEVRENREVTAGLRADIDRMRGEVGLGPDLQQRLARTRAALRDMAPWIPTPVLGNYLLPLEDRIRACVQGLPVDLEAVSEYDRLDLSAWDPHFKAFRIRVTARAGFNGLARCFHALHTQFPLASLAALNIVPDEADPESHHASVVLAWPIWADPAARPDAMPEPESGPAAPVEPAAGSAP